MNIGNTETLAEIITIGVFLLSHLKMVAVERQRFLGLLAQLKMKGKAKAGGSLKVLFSELVYALEDERQSQRLVVVYRFFL